MIFHIVANSLCHYVYYFVTDFSFPFSFLGWNSLQLIHLCFADDHMIFVNADLHSVGVIQAIAEFNTIAALG